MTRTLLTSLRLALPLTMPGVAGIVALVLSLYFSVRRHEGHLALFFIYIGLLLAVAEALWRLLTGYGQWIEASGFHALVATVWPKVLVGSLWSLVLPLAISAPATWLALRAGAQGSARRRSWWAASMVVVALDLLLIVVLYSFIYAHPPWF